MSEGHGYPLVMWGTPLGKRFESKDRNNLFKDFSTTLNPHSHHSHYKLSHEI